MEAAIIGVCGTLLGTVLGWRLSHHTAREVAREERQWQEDRAIRHRHEAAAEALREAVIDVQDVTPQYQISCTRSCLLPSFRPRRR